MLKWAKYLLTGLLSVAALIVAVLWLVSPGRTESFDLDLYPDSVAEVINIELNGVSQRLLIRGQDKSNPVLLHVHGGPGGADQAVMREFNFDLEDRFTIVYWDQRGAGASYSKELDVASLSLQQIVEDGLELSTYLRERFSKQKIYLQGHSWGSLVGVHMANNDPEQFHAYFGIGQVANSKRAEELSFRHAVKSAQLAGDEKSVSALHEIGPPPYKTAAQWKGAVMKQRALLQPYEMPDGSRLMTIPEMYSIYTLYRGYTIRDKLAALDGAAVSLDKMWMDAIDANLFQQVPKLDIPVYIFQGKHDYHTVTAVAQNYFKALEAPKKQYFEFENSAHWPHLREFEKYREIVLSVLDSSPQ